MSTENNSELLFRITSDGELLGIYSKQLVELLGPLVGKFNIRRASFVEPDESGEWWIDLTPVGGPRMGPYPVGDRDRALADEVQWLRQNLIEKDD